MFQIQNLTNKEYILEVVPPSFKLSGILVTPNVIEMKPKSAQLFSVQYASDFRIFNGVN